MQPGLQQHAARLSVITAFAALPFTAAVTGFVVADAAAAVYFQLHTMQMTVTDLQLAVYNMKSGLPCRSCSAASLTSCVDLEAAALCSSMG